MKEDRPAKIGFDTSGIGKVVGKVVPTVVSLKTDKDLVEWVTF